MITTKDYYAEVIKLVKSKIHGFGEKEVRTPDGFSTAFTKKNSVFTIEYSELAKEVKVIFECKIEIYNKSTDDITQKITTTERDVRYNSIKLKKNFDVEYDDIDVATKAINNYFKKLPKEITESYFSILDTINETMFLNRLQSVTYDKVKNAFFANYLAALTLIRLQDLKGLMMINDPAHSKLTRFSDSMSDVNFWGRAMFYPNEHEVKSRLANYEPCDLKILDARIQKMMKVPLTSPEQIDWDDAIGSLLLLKHRCKLNSSYFNNIVYALHKWDSINDSAKKRALNQAFMYLMQSDPHTKILDRMRVLSSSTMVGGLNKVAQRIIGFRKLSEDGEGAGTSVGAIASTSGANAIVAGKGAGSQGSSEPVQNIQDVLAGLYKLKKKSPYQVTKKSGKVFKDGKVIKRKVKTFVARKFKAPDYMRAVKKQGEK